MDGRPVIPHRTPDETAPYVSSVHLVFKYFAHLKARTYVKPAQVNQGQRVLMLIESHGPHTLNCTVAYDAKLRFPDAGSLLCFGKWTTARGTRREDT